MVIHGNYVFSGSGFSSASPISCPAGCAQLTVYKVQGDTAGRVASLALPTSTEPFAYQIGGSNAPVASLAYHAGLLFFGLTKTVRGDEFNIVDVRDPEHPRWLSGYPVGRTVSDISVRGTIAYASTDDPTRELMAFDVRDPKRAALYASWNAPGSSTFGYGSASTAYENTVRFGRTYTSSDPEFYLLSISPEGIFSSIAQMDSGTTKDPESVRSLLTQDRTTFMLLTHRLEVLDTHDHAQASLIGTYPLPQNSQGIAFACRNNQLYVARNSPDGTGVIDILQGS